MLQGLVAESGRSEADSGLSVGETPGGNSCGKLAAGPASAGESEGVGVGGGGFASAAWRAFSARKRDWTFSASAKCFTRISEIRWTTPGGQMSSMHEMTA